MVWIIKDHLKVQAFTGFYIKVKSPNEFGLKPAIKKPKILGQYAKVPKAQMSFPFHRAHHPLQNEYHIALTLQKFKNHA